MVQSWDWECLSIFRVGSCMVQDWVWWILSFYPEMMTGHQKIYRAHFPTELSVRAWLKFEVNRVNAFLWITRTHDVRIDHWLWWCLWILAIRSGANLKSMNLVWKMAAPNNVLYVVDNFVARWLCKYSSTLLRKAFSRCPEKIERALY